MLVITLVAIMDTRALHSPVLSPFAGMPFYHRSNLIVVARYVGAGRPVLGVCVATPLNGCSSAHRRGSRRVKYDTIALDVVVCGTCAYSAGDCNYLSFTRNDSHFEK